MARTFFENWKAQLKWHRFESSDKFTQMIDAHRNGITAYYKASNKFALGLVEGLNNKIRALQPLSYGLRDQEHLSLKVLTCMLPEL